MHCCERLILSVLGNRTMGITKRCSCGPRWCVQSRFIHVQLFTVPWTVARQAPLSMGFPRPEDLNGLPSPPPGDLPHPGIKPMPPVFPALAGRFSTTAPPTQQMPFITGPYTQLSIFLNCALSSRRTDRISLPGCRAVRYDTATSAGDSAHRFGLRLL